MTVNIVGHKIDAALKDFFPDRLITARETDYTHVLSVSWVVGEKRFAAHTPFGVDYRQRDYQHWLHKFAEIIRGKLQ